MALRALDDIKESVRAAAVTLARALRRCASQLVSMALVSMALVSMALVSRVRSVQLRPV